MNLVFDIGFNRGEFTHECLRKYPDCRIVGIEANPILCEDAPRHPNLTIVHAVASDRADEKVEFFIEPAQDGISTASRHLWRTHGLRKEVQIFIQIQPDGWHPSK